MSTTPAHRTSGVTESKLMSGSQILLECLVRENVDCIFGYPGGVTLPLYDALYDHPIRHVLVRHEQNAAFAAEGLRAIHRKRRRLLRHVRAPAPPTWSPDWWMP